MKPSDVHPTHDVREEGVLVSDPVCQKCRASVYGSPSRLLTKCDSTVKYRLTVEMAEYKPAGGPLVMIWVNNRDTQRGGYSLECVPRYVAPLIVSALLTAMNHTRAAADVVEERLRQINNEGWSPDHDDEHDKGELAAAAACYAYGEELESSTGPIWPWEGGLPVKWPLDRRRELVKAGALILAEIERIDRATDSDKENHP